jgi:hypothetical protein
MVVDIGWRSNLSGGGVGGGYELGRRMGLLVTLTQPPGKGKSERCLISAT